MELIRTCLLFCIFSYMLLAYENVALFKPTWQKYKGFGNTMGPDLAVDGRYSNLSADGGECTVTSLLTSLFTFRYTDEWRVDLGNVFSIHHIFIQYMTNNEPWDENNEYTTEFLRFSVYISNTTNKSEGVLCFRDTLYTKATIPNPINITCLNHGRYVIYYNNRIEGNHNQYSTFAYNNLCEVEIYGCPSGTHGENCSLTCPVNCLQGRCNIVTGTCLGCVAEFTGEYCEEAGASPCGHGHEAIEDKGLNVKVVAKATNTDSRAHVTMDFVETTSHVIPLTEVVNMAARKDIKGSIVTKLAVMVIMDTTAVNNVASTVAFLRDVTRTVRKSVAPIAILRAVTRKQGSVLVDVKKDGLDLNVIQELSQIQTQHAYNRDQENGYLTANEFNAEIHNVMGLNTQHSAISKISETKHDKTHGYLEIIDMEPDETTINTSSV
ncbi:uncharacterized protein LOC111106256 [Crassostrea virginica]